MKEKGILVLGSEKYSCLTIYDVKKYNKGITLAYSKLQESWTNPGKNAYSLENNGNGFDFIDERTGEVIRLDYSQAEAIRALLKLDDTQGSKFKYYKG